MPAGLTPLGTLEAPTFPEFLTSNPLPDGRPWGLRTAEGTNQYRDRPNNPVTRRYEFTVKRGKKAPDGYLRDVLLVNDQYPGPTIEANWGDMIEVKVNNQITGPEEGTAMHWHGLLQNETPWYDGTPSVHQCPIAPGKSFTYRFKADLYGTSWWHSHYSAQYAGGLHGAMIIHGPSHVRYDRDLGPVFINDWDHREYFEIVKDVMSTEGNDFPPTVIIPQSDNNLINGKNNFNCSSIRDTDNTPCTDNAGLSKFRFQSGRTHRLRLINSGAEGLQRFSIDGHTLTVIANDFVPVRPYDTKVVTLGIGQRTDVVVRATGRPGDAYWMRALMPKDTVCAQTKNPLALAVVLYERADRNAKPNTTAWPDEPGVDPCDNVWATEVELPYLLDSH